MRRHLKRAERGFTLIELMVVIAIIALLAAMLFPNLKGYMDQAKVTALVTAANEIATNAASEYMVKGAYPSIDDIKNYDINKTDPWTKNKIVNEVADADTTNGIYIIYTSEFDNHQAAFRKQAKGTCPTINGNTYPEGVVIDLSNSASMTVYACYGS